MGYNPWQPSYGFTVQDHLMLERKKLKPHVEKKNGEHKNWCGLSIVAYSLRL